MYTEMEIQTYKEKVAIVYQTILGEEVLLLKETPGLRKMNVGKIKSASTPLCVNNFSLLRRRWTFPAAARDSPPPSSSSSTDIVDVDRDSPALSLLEIVDTAGCAAPARDCRPRHASCVIFSSALRHAVVIALSHPRGLSVVDSRRYPHIKDRR
ncbi:hypothetical protein Syun_021765 [Stephania yunnanensis]|uniref:Uncharacterized protein n=1 Tax=Stephania yunnanensis TaxID=152371 RepID=A0AAP0NQ10_9MAGN